VKTGIQRVRVRAKKNRFNQFTLFSGFRINCGMAEHKIFDTLLLVVGWFIQVYLYAVVPVDQSLKLHTLMRSL
jgi:hypothetical protein